MALGFFGWKPAEFWDSTPREFAAAWRGWVKARDIEEQSQWERARMLAYFAISPYSKNKRLKPTDIMNFDWDKPVKAKRTKYGNR